MNIAVKNTKINYTTVWEPQEGPQTWLLTCPVFEILFGGARGGGKSDGVLGEWAAHADEYGENAIGLCVRRERTQLVELIERSRILYIPLGAKFDGTEKMWRFPNGARLRFAYLESDEDAMAYQGHSYTRVYVEEMGTFPNPAPIFLLMGTLRSGAGVPCKFIATANPGGPGHSWIKARYIDPHPSGMKVLKSTFIDPTTNKPAVDPQTGDTIIKERVFIPSKISDNKYTNNAAYIGNLYMAGGPELVKAWLLGDWNVMLGAFFPEFSMHKHVIRTFKIPKHWTRFMSMDWGSAKPFSIGWWAVVPDEYDIELEVSPSEWRLWQNPKEIFTLPKGAIIRYREWYGSRDNLRAKNFKDAMDLTNSTENKNVGGYLTAEEVAEGINQRETEEPKNSSGRPNISWRVADPAIFANTSGPSIAERMGARPYYVDLIRADNKRVGSKGALGGWDAVRQRLKGDGITPMIFFMDNCVDAIRTLPILQHNQNNPEDADSEGEDHAPDEIRYACMSRPYSAPHGLELVKRILKKKDNTSLAIHDDISDLRAPRFNPRIF